MKLDIETSKGSCATSDEYSLLCGNELTFENTTTSGSRYLTPQTVAGSYTISYDLAVKIIQGCARSEKLFLDFVFNRQGANK